jgi:uncharacterized phage protein (TIGR02218 family)
MWERLSSRDDMRTISANLDTHLAGELGTTALCWKVRRRDGTVEGWTEHDEPIPWDGVDYLPLPAGAPSNYQQKAALAPANMELEINYGDQSAALLRAGYYDFAEVWTFRINWADTSQGIVKMAYGRLGEISMADSQARADVRGLAQILSTQIGRIYTPECPASLGDTRCKVNLASYTHTGTVGTVTSNRQFVITGAAAGKAGDYYNYGKFVWLTGANAGHEMQVEDYNGTNDVITLMEFMPGTVAPGDTASLEAGCDRRKTTCISRFTNILNFRGFDSIPGMDKALNMPANRKWVED